MNLVQQEVVYKYKTFELLESMIELSRVNIDRLQRMGVDRVSQLRSGMTSFDTGRQTGKSTAIARYFRENDDVIIVSRTRAQQKTMAGGLQSFSIFNLCVGDFNDRHKFKGIRGEFDLIFDECNLEDILHCLWCLGEYPSIKIQSIVKVGVE